LDLTHYIANYQLLEKIGSINDIKAKKGLKLLELKQKVYKNEPTPSSQS